MLSKLRDFSKSKLAGVLITIIIIPFVFWGMGSVFSGGNTNNVVKINNKKISTQDFIEHINTSNIDPDQLRKNLDKNVLEEILGQLISLNILKMEIQNLGIIKSDKSLSESIIKEKRFLDDDGKFSRTKYEKFLIENNVTAGEFERKIREGSQQKELFNYISGGIKSPNFITKSLFLDETKQVNIKYFNLDKHYKNNFTDEEINEYINRLEEKYLKLNVIITGGDSTFLLNKIKNAIFADQDFLAIGLNNILKYKGLNIGRSICEKNIDNIIHDIFSYAKKNDCQIYFPKDVKVGKRLNDKSIEKNFESIEDDDIILDVGSKTLIEIKKIIDNSSTLLWNGPLGYFENINFSLGSSEIAKYIASKGDNIFSVVGGGDTVAVINSLNMINNFNFVSTAGGAFLEYLEGKILPGIKALN